MASGAYLPVGTSSLHDLTADLCERQARCDEKGFLAVAAFGLPGRTHEDGPARALSAALAIVQGLQVHCALHHMRIFHSTWHLVASMSNTASSRQPCPSDWVPACSAAMYQAAGERGCIGVTTGQVLCACVGSRLRAEYTVFGDAINLAARLMGCAAAGEDAVLCDFRTRELAKDAATFTPLPPMVLKVRQHSSCTAVYMYSFENTDPGCQQSRINRCAAGCLQQRHLHL